MYAAPSQQTQSPLLEQSRHHNSEAGMSAFDPKRIPGGESISSKKAIQLICYNCSYIRTIKMRPDLRVQ